MVLQTITDYVFKFEINGKPIRRNLCCKIIGESVPPKLIELIIKQVIKISK